MMKYKTVSYGIWLTNLFIGFLLVYMIKTVGGINLIAECHAEEWILGECDSVKLKDKN
ncbi:hypothetical protein PCC7424_0570 [Gloeothece citriformis PCC 7424]|uniref:Uncharacterized protein n=1 Tax=Gloeothece citriformis (strain PCC 7424) TaxID=65393 RepID=B7KEK7_GLOC7|nr:hypothetical protein [Gloeothece citriformis]ACK69032.1 hypothetical protein PCC7424_0570 [Gloeothece citriformis PCC 7424]